MLDGSEQGGDVLPVHAEILEGEGVFCRFGTLGPIAANPVAAGALGYPLESEIAMATACDAMAMP